ncbi:MAG: ankyrin repeat domain-containing protein [Nitrospirota bacterium]|jgi:hypothetical protein
MKRLFVLLFILIAIFLVSRAEAKSLKKGEIYRSLQGDTIEVISKSELEISERGKTILAEYDFKGDKLRVVTNVVGTKMVTYYLLTKEGLKDEKTGEVYYSKDTLPPAVKMQERVKEEKREREKMQTAVISGDTKMVKILLDKGADVNAVNVRTSNGWTAFITAARDGHTEIIKILLDKGANVNATNYDGATALQWAAGGGFTEIVKVLLVKGADVNAKSDNGYTALMWAAMNGYYEIVKILLDKGADVNPKDQWGRSAFKRAEEKRHIDIVELLRKAGAK